MRPTPRSSCSKPCRDIRTAWLGARSLPADRLTPRLSRRRWATAAQHIGLLLVVRTTLGLKSTPVERRPVSHRLKVTPGALVLFGYGREDAAKAAVLEVVGVALEGDDLGVMDGAIDHGGGGLIAEDSTPAGEVPVRGDEPARSWREETSWKNRLAARLRRG